MSGAWPILGLSVHSPEIEVAAMQAANTELADYGIAITRLGNLDINLDDDDNARLKKLAGDTAYSRLAGGFLQAAQAEALQGAGEGHGQGRRGRDPDVPRRRPGRGQPDDAGAAAARRAARRRPVPASPAAGRASPRRRSSRHRPQQAPAAAGPGSGPGPGPGRDGRLRQLPQPGPRGREVLRQCGTPMQKHCTNCNASLSRQREVLRRVRHPGQPAAGLTDTPAFQFRGAPPPGPGLPFSPALPPPWGSAASHTKGLPEMDRIRVPVV